MRARKVAAASCRGKSVPGILLALALLLFPACGRKTAPQPPELVRPQQVASLAAENVAAGVRLEWSRPREYVGGARMTDLARFHIERRESAGEFREIEVLTVEDRDRFRQLRSFHTVDETALEGALYEYRIIAETLDGSRSDPSPTAEIRREAPTNVEKKEPAENG